MQAKQLLTFGPYRFDPHTGQLWRGKQEVKVTLKAAAVLGVVVKRAEATIKIGTEQGFPYWVAQGTMFLGSALAELEQKEEGLALLRRGLAAQRAIGGRILEQYWLALQLEVHRKVEQFEQGLA